MFRSYKITPRAVNAHAQVNAAFLARVDPSDLSSLGAPSVVYGGLGPSSPAHAFMTEQALADGNYKDQSFLESALAALDQEIEPEDDPVLPSVAFRKHLTKALLYKFFLQVLGDQADADLQSGATQIERQEPTVGLIEPY